MPIIFAIYFALFRHKEAAMFTFVAATGSSILLFLVKKENFGSFAMSIAACLLGGFAGMSIISTLHEPVMNEELVKITIGVICGYLLMKLLVVFEKVLNKFEAKEKDRESIDKGKVKSSISKE